MTGHPRSHPFRKIAQILSFILGVSVGIAAFAEDTACSEPVTNPRAWALKFGPEFVYDKDEPNLPVTVEWLLSRTSLYNYWDGRDPDRVLVAEGS